MAGKSSKSKLKKAAKAAKRAGKLAKQAQLEEARVSVADTNPEADKVTESELSAGTARTPGSLADEAGAPPDKTNTDVRAEPSASAPPPSVAAKPPRQSQPSTRFQASKRNTGSATGQSWHPYHKRFLTIAAICLCIAAAIGALLLVASLLLIDGEKALLAILGLEVAIVKPLTARLIVVLDTLLPVYYGTGLAMLAAAFHSRGIRPLVRLFLAVLMLAVAADFAENALAFNGMMGASNKGIHLPFSFAKYGLLAFGCILLSVILPGNSALGRALIFLLRYVFPVSTAVLVSGLNSSSGILMSVAGLPVLFILLAWLSVREIGR